MQIRRWYFLLLGADYHRHLFGEVARCAMRSNGLGRLVEQFYSAGSRNPRVTVLVFSWRFGSGPVSRKGL